MIRPASFAVLLLLAACFGSSPEAWDGELPERRIYVTSNDWHTRIVVATADLPEPLLPEALDFPAARWLAFGWGDHRYYPTPSPPGWLALEAALLPSPAVLHIVPMPSAPSTAPGFEVLAIELGEAAHRRLLQALDDAVARDGGRRAQAVAPGLYPDSRFYPATGTFHLFNTCNRWVAQKLAAAGLPVRTWGVVTAEDLLRQLRDPPMVALADG